MAKGFGAKQDEQLGYILVLLPEVHAYAAKFSLDIDRSGEKFIGITNMLGSVLKPFDPPQPSLKRREPDRKSPFLRGI
jgi:hypothetical protein